jgi:hypothetical protein
MPPSHVPVQDIETVRTAIILAITGVAFFWRFVLRVMLAIIMVATGLGLLMVLQHIYR